MASLAALTAVIISCCHAASNYGENRRKGGAQCSLHFVVLICGSLNFIPGFFIICQYLSTLPKWKIITFLNQH